MKMKVEYIPDKININIFFILIPVNNYYKSINIIHDQNIKAILKIICYIYIII